MPTGMIHVRVDDDTKQRALAALDAMGLTLSEAVRVFLSRVAAEQAIPFAIKVPNQETQAAMHEARRLGHGLYQTADALFDALAEAGQ